MDEGALLAYVAETDSLNINMAHQADQIFKGAKSGDIPIQRTTTYRLTINLGLAIPLSLLARADQLIE
jgi:putative ABC transport system substrate-binding protein